MTAKTRLGLEGFGVRRFGGAAAVSYSLTCAAGAYTYSGVDATLTRSATTFTLSVAAGAYTWTIADTIAAHNGLTVAVGTYALASPGAGLSSTVGSTFTLTGATGTYAWSIADEVTITAGLVFAAGTYGVTGQTALLTKALSGEGITCAAGAYTLEGAISVNDTVLAVSAGAFVLTGQAANLQEVASTYTLPCVAGTYTWAIADTITVFGGLTVAAGTYAQVGQDAALGSPTDPAMLALGGTYGVTGVAATLTPTLDTTFALPCATGAYVWAIADEVTVTYGLSLGAGAFGVTGVDSGLVPNIAGTRSISASPGAFVLEGAISANDPILAVFAGDYALTGGDVAFIALPDLVLGAATGTYAYAGTTAGLAAGRKLACATGTFSLTGSDAGAVKGRPFTAAAGAYALNGVDIEFVLGESTLLHLDAEVGSYTLDGSDAEVDFFYKAADRGHIEIIGGSARFFVSRRRRRGPPRGRGMTDDYALRVSQALRSGVLKNRKIRGY